MRAARSAGLMGLLTLAAAACATANNDENLGGNGGNGGATSSVSSSAVTASSASTTVASSSVASTTASSTSSAASSTSSGMTTCGNGMLDPGEGCEGTDFGGKTCATFGLSGGMLICNPFCGIVVSSCTPKENCVNGNDDDQDGDLDCDDSECAMEPVCTDSCASPKVTTVPTFEFGSISGRPNTITSSCMPMAGREIVYQFVAPTAQDISVQLFFSDFQAGLAIRTACDDPASEVACQTGQQLSFTPVAGQTYFLVIEALDNGNGSFDFQLDSIFPEDFCSNFSDDDFDGFMDCDDPDNCQASSFDCVPGTGAPGTSCFSNGECFANANDPICFPSFQGWPNGYCSEFCNLAANDCSGDAQCIQLGLSTNGVCLDGCNTTLDCAPGYYCLDEGAPMKVCDRPPELQCNDNNDNDGDGFVDCEDVTSCSTSPSCTSGPGPAGSPCQIHNQCHSETTDPFCIDQFNFGWPGGYCSEYCNLSADDCPAGSACSTWLFTPSPSGLCMQTCVTSADCRPGFVCLNDGNHDICVN